MSQVFERYERQYCELSANLSKKCTSANALDGGFYETRIAYYSWRGAEGYRFAAIPAY